MEEMHYYLNWITSFPSGIGRDGYIYTFTNSDYKDSYFLMRCKCTVKVRKKKGLFNDRYEQQECEGLWAIPVLLYGNGKEFYEFFSKQLFGRINHSKSKSAQKPFVDKEMGVPDVRIHNLSGECTIHECDASEFLEWVRIGIADAARAGFSEQDIRNGMRNLFSEAKKEYEAEKLMQRYAQQVLRDMLK